MALVPFGYGMGVLSTVMFNIAPVMQKSGMDQVVAATGTGEKVKLTAYVKNKIWVAGFIVALLGGIPFLVALSVLGLSVIQPLSALGYILLAIVASKTLGERPGKTTVTGIAMLCAMPLFLSFAGVSNIQVDMASPATQLTFIIACVVLSVVCLALAIVDKFLVKEEATSSMLWAILSGIGFALGGLLIQSVLGILEAGGHDLFRDFLQVFVLLASGDIFVFSAVVVGLICGVSNLLSFVAQQIGIKRGKATIAFPVSQSVNILVSSAGGIFIFGQVATFPALYIIALVFAITGTVLVGKYQGTVIGSE